MHKFLVLIKVIRDKRFYALLRGKKRISNAPFVLMLFSVDLTGCSVLINRLFIIRLYLHANY
jgi:hypothetical protein